MSSRTLKVGTRGSTLATTQAGHVRDALIAAGYPAELVIVRTRGDVVMAPVERIGVGVFTLELRAALVFHRLEQFLGIGHDVLQVAVDRALGVRVGTHLTSPCG